MDDQTKRQAKKDQDDGADMTDQVVEYALKPSESTFADLHRSEHDCIVAPVRDLLIEFAVAVRGGQDSDKPIMDRLVDDLVARSGSRIAFMPFSLKAVEIGISRGRRIRVFVDPAKKEAPEVIVTEVLD